MAPTGPAHRQPTPPQATHRDPATAVATIDVHLAAEDIAGALAADVRRGLGGTPKSLPPKWFYDQRGSELFDEITRLPEYYPTEAERAILRAVAGEIAERSGADTVIELGSGTSDKTRTLLDAFAAAGQLRRFVPFDVSEATLREAAALLRRAYPGVHIHGVVGDFERHLHVLPRTGRRLVLFLGGTIGNLDPQQRRRFLTELRAGLRPDDSLLLGTDLVKPLSRLLPAYDDDAGVTAAFNRNVLTVINRELDADFDPERFTHEARWNVDKEWIEMHLVADRAHRVHIGSLDMTVEFADGESIHTEISAKFREPTLRAELAAAGFDLEAFWTDPAGEFGLSLCRPAGAASAPTAG